MLNQNKCSKSDKPLQFNLYAYAPPTDGTYTIDGEEFFTGQDFRTVERYKEYKDCGFNILFAQGSGYYDEPFEGSELQMVMDRAYEAGIEKIIFRDMELFYMSHQKSPIAGQGARFKNEEELEAYVAARMKNYMNHPAFYGLQLIDEPSYLCFDAIGQLYKAIKKACPRAVVQCNLLPAVYGCRKKYPPGDIDQNDLLYDYRYTEYLNMFLDKTGADYILFDIYPLRGDGAGISSQFVRCLQTAARICKERNVELRQVTQTFEMLKKNKYMTFRAPEGDADMYWLLNMMMGFGTKEISYFTYFTKQTNRTEGELFIDGGSIINRDGTQTQLYGILKRIHAEMQKFAPVLLNFRYNASTYFMGKKVRQYAFYLDLAKKEELKYITSVTVDKESVFVSELIDDSGQVMYMVLNIINPAWENGEKTLENISVKFTDKFKKVTIYDRGEKSEIELDENNSISFKLKPGYAYYILPY